MQRNQLLVFGVVIILVAIILIKPQFKNNQVKNIASDANALVDECEKQSNWQRCYANRIGEYNKIHNLDITLKVLDKVENLDVKTRGCHLLAHKIATSEVEKDPSKWLEIFNFVDQTSCTNGFIHGVLEGRSRFDSNFKIDENVIPQICQQIEEKTSKRTKLAIDDACAHVLGHILLAEQDGDIEKSVQVCEKVDKESYRSHCFNGIFMENITRDNLLIHSEALPMPMNRSSANDLEILCEKFQGIARIACFREIAHLYTLIDKNEPLAVFKDCMRGKNKEEGKACYFHALNLFIADQKFTSQELANLCINFVSEDDLKNCISFYLGPLLFSSTKFIDRATDFCLNVNEDMRGFCFRAIGDKLEKLGIDDNQRLNLCSVAPEEYVNLCAGGH